MAAVDERVALARPDARFSRLSRWLVTNGGMVPSIGFGGDDGGAPGAHALSAIAPDEVVLRVPARSIMSTQAARRSSIGRTIAGAGGAEEDDHTLLAAYLASERRAGRSFWQPYIAALPREFPEMPVFFGERELSLLRGSFTLEQIAARRQSLKRAHDDLRRVRELDWLKQDEFIWARLVVSSRVFGMTIAGEETIGLVPGADMLNHAPEQATSWGYCDEEEAFLVEALRPFSVGEPVHDSYGAKCNGCFFVDYGFALERNSANRAAIMLPTDPDLADVAPRLGGEPRGSRTRFFIRADYDDPATQGMFSFLRVACAVGRERESAMTALSRGPCSIGFLGRAGEERALRLLATSCESALAAFDTTLEEDEALLRRPLDRLRRTCVLVRLGEKRVLRDHLRLAGDAIEFLRTPWRESAPRIRQLLGRAGGLRRYFQRDVIGAIKSERR